MVSRVLSAALVATVLCASSAVPVRAAGEHKAHTNTIRGHRPGAAGVAGPAVSPAAPFGYIPCDITKAYGLDLIPGDGAGQTIAIVDAFNLKDPQGDFLKFDTTFLRANAGKLDVHQMSATAGDANAQGWADEIDLDIQWTHGMAPAAHIWLVEAASESTPDMLAAIDWAVNNTSPDVVLMAWTIIEPEAGHDEHFPPVINGNHPVAYVGATGDSPPTRMVGWPSNSPRVLSAGATTLRQEAAGYAATPVNTQPAVPDHTDCAAAGASQRTPTTETAWYGTISGPSTVVARPAYQAGYVSGSSRVVPDVALVGAFAPGLAVFSKDAAGWIVLGGDSASATVLAGILARQYTERAHVTEPSAWYQLAALGAFNDITIGSSAGSNGSDAHQAGPGFDIATGRGSPRGASWFPRGHLVTVTPSRILETRGPPNFTPIGPPGMLPRGTPYDLTLPSPPAGAGPAPSAVVLNVTAVDASEIGFVAAFGADAAWSGSSTVNFGPGTAATDLVLAPVANGKVRFISSAPVDLAVDIFGWVTDSTAGSTSGGRLVPMTPTRIIDTRPTPFNRGPWTTPWPAGAAGREIIPPGLPATAKAVVLNLTAIDTPADGFLAAYDATWSGTSNVNYAAGQIVPNRVVVGLNANRGFFVNSSRTTDVAIDISGYFDAGAAATFTVAQPLRLYDSRDAGAGGAVVAGSPRRVQVGGARGVPLGIQAVALNVTVTDPASAGYVVAYPDAPAIPGSSDLNVVPNQTATNLVIVKVALNGNVDFAFGSDPGSTATLVVDLAGWYG